MKPAIIMIIILCAFICTSANGQTTVSGDAPKSVTAQLTDRVEGLDIWGFVWIASEDGNMDVPKIRLRTTYKSKGNFYSFLDLDLAQFEDPSGDWVQEAWIAWKLDKWDLKFGRIFTGDYTVPPFKLSTVGYHSSASNALDFFSWGSQLSYEFNDIWSFKTTFGARGGPFFDDKRAFEGYGLTSYLKGAWTDGDFLVGSQMSDEKWSLFANGTLTPGNWFLRGGIFYGSERGDKLRGYVMAEYALFNDILHPYVQLEHAGEFIPKIGLGLGNPNSRVYFVVDYNHDKSDWGARLQVRF